MKVGNTTPLLGFSKERERVLLTHAFVCLCSSLWNWYDQLSQVPDAVPPGDGPETATVRRNKLHPPVFLPLQQQKWNKGFVSFKDYKIIIF